MDDKYVLDVSVRLDGERFSQFIGMNDIELIREKFNRVAQKYLRKEISMHQYQYEDMSNLIELQLWERTARQTYLGIGTHYYKYDKDIYDDILSMLGLK